MLGQHLRQLGAVRLLQALQALGLRGLQPACRSAGTATGGVKAAGRLCLLQPAIRTQVLADLGLEVGLPVQ